MFKFRVTALRKANTMKPVFNLVTSSNFPQMLSSSSCHTFGVFATRGDAIELLY